MFGTQSPAKLPIWLKFCTATEIRPGLCVSHFGGDHIPKSLQMPDSNGGQGRNLGLLESHLTMRGYLENGKSEIFIEEFQCDGSFPKM